MTFTIVGYDTYDMVEIYDTVDAATPEDAQVVARKAWPSSSFAIIAIYSGEPENFYDPDTDPCLDEDYEEIEDLDEDEEDEEDDDFD